MRVKSGMYIVYPTEFWDDVATCFEMKDHPMFNPMSYYAYDHGHSAGLENVLCVFEGLYYTFESVIKEYNMIKKL